MVKKCQIGQTQLKRLGPVAASRRSDVNDTLPVAKKLIEGTIFTPDPLEAPNGWRRDGKPSRVCFLKHV